MSGGRASVLASKIHRISRAGADRSLRWGVDVRILADVKDPNELQRIQHLRFLPPIRYRTDIPAGRSQKGSKMTTPSAVEATGAGLVRPEIR
jgi:hypothetical protein